MKSYGPRSSTCRRWPLTPSSESDINATLIDPEPSTSPQRNPQRTSFKHLPLEVCSELFCMIWVFPKIWENPQIIHLFIGFSIINHPFWGTPEDVLACLSTIHWSPCRSMNSFHWTVIIPARFWASSTIPFSVKPCFADRGFHLDRGSGPCNELDPPQTVHEHLRTLGIYQWHRPNKNTKQTRTKYPVGIS